MIDNTRASETSQAEQKMALSTKRQSDIAKALTLQIPGAPFLDAEKIRETAARRKYRFLPVSTSVWLAAIAHIRHAHSEYDTLLEEGYEKDAARHFCLDAINDKLTDWRSSRLLDPSEDPEMAGLAEEDEVQ
jgi:hypothetical protein